MCTGKCSKFIGLTLYPLALISVICNILLFFPDWSTKYAEEDQDAKPRLTDEVKYMGGLIGGGILVLIPAIHIHLTGKEDGCCAGRCGMFLSIGFAGLGLVGGLYSMAVAAVGLANGPVCKAFGIWGRPFANDNGSYLSHPDIWALCTEPEDVVKFNVGLFSTLMVVAGVQMALCGFQMVNGLFGFICGTCGKEN